MSGSPIDLCGAVRRKGGMAYIYLIPGQPLAIKVPLPDRRADTPNARAFANEIRMAQLLMGIKHPALIKYMGEVQCLAPKGRTCAGLAMEKLEGESLFVRIERVRVGLEAALEIGRQIAEGLGVLHDNGIVHRDIKPENVMLAENRGAVLHDLAVAGKVGTTEGFPGTAAYAAPQTALTRQVSVEQDFYNLGATLFMTFTGQSAHGDDGWMDVTGMANTWELEALLAQYNSEYRTQYDLRKLPLGLLCRPEGMYGIDCISMYPNMILEAANLPTKLKTLLMKFFSDNLLFNLRRRQSELEDRVRRASLPGGAEGLVLSLMAFEESDRPGSAQTVIAKIDQVKAGLPKSRRG